MEVLWIGELFQKWLGRSEEPPFRSGVSLAQTRGSACASGAASPFKRGGRTRFIGGRGMRVTAVCCGLGRSAQKSSFFSRTPRSWCSVEVAGNTIPSRSFLESTVDARRLEKRRAQRQANARRERRCLRDRKSLAGPPRIAIAPPLKPGRFTNNSLTLRPCAGECAAQSLLAPLRPSFADRNSS